MTTEFGDIVLNPDETSYYGVIFRASDIGNKGFLSTPEAVAVLKKSGLADNIWQLSGDPNGQMKPAGFAKAMKLVALAQTTGSAVLDLARIETISTLATVEGFVKPTQLEASAEMFVLLPEERARFVDMFNKCGPRNGVIDGATAGAVFIKSKLPEETLAKIWSLVDINNAGVLNSNQFCTAMLIIQKYMTGKLTVLPNSLPPAVTSLFFPTQTTSTFSSELPSATQSSLNLGGSAFFRTPNEVSPSRRVSSLESSSITNWNMSADDRKKFETYFNNLDTFKKGYLTGEEAGPFFMKSKLPDTVLAQIWELVDTDQSGQLDCQKFSVAMFLIQKKMSGATLPLSLPPGLLSPSNISPAPLNPVNTRFSDVIVTPTMSSSPTLDKKAQLMAPILDNTALQDKQKEVQSKKEELTQLQNQISAATVETSDAFNRRIALEQEVMSLNREIEDCRQKLASSRASRDSELEKIDKLQQQYLSGRQELQEIRLKLQAEEEQLGVAQEQLQRSHSEIQQLKSAVEQARLAYAEKTATREQFMKQIENNANETKSLQITLANLNTEISTIKDQTDRLAKEDAVRKSALSAARSQVMKAKEEKEQHQKNLVNYEATTTFIPSNVATAAHSAQSPLTPMTVVSDSKVTQRQDDWGWDTISVRSTKSDGAALKPAVNSQPDRKPASVFEFDNESAKNMEMSNVNINENPFGSSAKIDSFDRPVSKNEDNPFDTDASFTSYGPNSSPLSKANVTTHNTSNNISPNNEMNAFENKFPSVQDFEDAFKPVSSSSSPKSKPTEPVVATEPSPFDEFDAEFSQLQNAAPLSTTVVAEDAFSAAFDDFKPFETSRDPQAPPPGAAPLPKKDDNSKVPENTTQQPFMPQADFDAFEVDFKKPANQRVSFPSDDDIDAKPSAQTINFDDVFGGSSTPVQPTSDVSVGDPFQPSAEPANVTFGDFTSVPPAANTFTDFSSSVVADTSFFDNAPSNEQPPNVDSSNLTNNSEHLSARQSSVEEILQMGFSEEQARAALAKCDNDMQRAINLLLDGGAVSAEPSPSARESTENAGDDSKSIRKKSSKWWKGGKKKKDDQ